jgi:dihydroxyacetone kinase
MNFGLAAELAAAEGIDVATVIAADDVASAPTESEARRRGIGGIFFLYKVAGASAAAGSSLHEVRAVTERAGSRLRSMGVALSPCIVPAAGRPTFELAEGEMEIGMGTHGEPGVRRGTLEPADAVADQLLDAILADMPVDSAEQVDVLVNGLGATLPEELYILFRRISKRLAEAGIGVRRAWIGEYATSLEMAGASISVSPGRRRARAPARRTRPLAALGARLSPLTSVIGEVCSEVRARANALNALDAQAGDGDLGVTMTTAASAIEEVLPTLRSLDAAAALRECGMTLARKAPSTAGTLVATGLIRASAALAADSDADFSTCLRAALEGMAERGGAEPGSKTMLDAVAPAVDASAGEPDFARAAARAAAAAEQGARATMSMTPQHGRAGWLADRSMGHEDAGARLVAVILGAAAHSVAPGSTRK